MNENRKRFKTRLKEINSLTGYTAGESTKHAARGSSLDPSKILKLNANENFWIPKDKLDCFLREVLEDVDPRLYPQEEEADLKEALGKYLNTPPESILIGSGSDPLLAFITQLFIGRGEQAFSISPTWSLYQLLVKLRGAKYFKIPLKNDFSIDIEKILANTSEARIFYLCSPNNPTANQFEEEKVLALVKNFPGLVVIDEAYGEFANYSAVQLVKNYENLIVTRTFSKIGLAALRLGYMVSNPNLSKILFKKAQLPYPVNSITLKMGIKLLANIKIVNKAVEQMKKERRRLIKELNEIDGVRAFDSQANFVLFQTKFKSAEIFKALLKQGVLIRNFGDVPRLNGCLRATVGLPEMNDKLIDGLKCIFER